MNEFTRTALGVIGSLAVVGAAGTLTYVLWNTADLELGESGSAQPSVEATIEASSSDFDFERFLAPNRDHLAICVDSAEPGAATRREAAEAIINALPQLAGMPGWVMYEFSKPEPEVVEGCPYESTMKDFLAAPGATPAPFAYFARRIREGGVHTAVSLFRVYAYVLPEHQVARLTEVYGRPLSAEEMLCEGDSCGQVTTAVYLTPQDLSDSTVVANRIAEALGLR